jgi:riboflavin biosynthesis pyrimidine reductase
MAAVDEPVAFERLLPAGAPASATEIAEAAFAGADGLRLVLNMVSTLDGRAAVGGTTRPLGGPADLDLLLELRAAADAVLIGTGTVRAEGYDRLVQRESRRARRRAAGRTEDPLAVLVSRSGDVPWEAGLFAAPAQPVLVYADATPPPGIAAPLEVAEPRDLPAVVDDLRARGVRRVLCEGGPGLNRALFSAGLVDGMCLTLSPVVTGDEEEPAIVSGGALADLVGLRLDGVARHGDELFLRYGRV